MGLDVHKDSISVGLLEPGVDDLTCHPFGVRSGQPPVTGFASGPPTPAMRSLPGSMCAGRRRDRRVRRHCGLGLPPGSQVGRGLLAGWPVPDPASSPRSSRRRTAWLLSPIARAVRCRLPR